MYFLYEFDKESTAYNIPSFFRLSSTLDVSRLELAFKRLAERHQSLRTVFNIIEDRPVQRILDGSSFEINYHKGEASEMTSHIDRFVRPFDLSQEIPVRVSLMDVIGEDYLLLVDMHHIINDGVSQDIIMQEFWSLYLGEKLPELHIQYKDYSTWQQGEEHQALVSDHKSYWLDTFAEEITVLDLPTDHPRSNHSNDAGDVYAITLDKSQSDKLRTLARAQGVTMYTLFLTIYNILLSKLSSQSDIIVGTPTAGRHHADLENIVGMFVNTLALRNHVDSNLTFKDFLASVQDKTLSAFDNQLYQYEELVEELELTRDTSRNPLFDVFFSYNQQMQDDDFDDSEIKITSHDVPYTMAKFDLELDVIDQGENYNIMFSYSLSLFKAETIKRFSEFLQKIITEVLSNEHLKLSEIDIISNEEKKSNRI